MRRLVRYVGAFVAAVVGAGCSHEPGSKAASPGATREVRVAVAASVKPVMPELVAAFMKTHAGIVITPTYGASGTFCSQITSGAPFDAFMSADAAYPQKLVDAGVIAGGVRVYAAGRLVVWARRDSDLDVAGKCMDILKDARVKKVAIANPAHAPYGRAAEAALAAGGFLESVRPRLVMGESVEQTAAFVRTGAAEIGVLARSQAVVPPLRDEGVMCDVPMSLYQPISHGAVVIKSAQDAGAAEEFVGFLTGSMAQKVLGRAGLGAMGK